jgi:integrase
MLVGEWLAAWRVRRVDLKPSTLAGYDSVLRTRILPTWGRVPLRRVERDAVVQWVTQMTAEGLSASRVRAAYFVFSAAMDDAVRANQLAANPAAGLELPFVPKRKHRYLTHHELARLARECGTAYGVLVLILGHTGLRWGEATALRVRNLDVSRGSVNVLQTVHEVNGRLVFDTPKRHQKRCLHVPSFVWDCLESHVEKKLPDDFVFTAQQGSVVRVGNFRRRSFDRAVARVGLTAFTPKDLRHTAASLAIASGATLNDVQAMLGHATSTITLTRYGHLWHEARRDDSHAPHHPARQADAEPAVAATL